MNGLLRYCLFPLVLGFYHGETTEGRGQFLTADRFVSPSDECLEIYFGRFPGLQYGTLRIQAHSPHLSMSRNDGVTIRHDFATAMDSRLDIHSSGFLILRRPKQPPFYLCGIKPVHAIQLVGVSLRWPDDIRRCLQPPEITAKV